MGKVNKYTNKKDYRKSDKKKSNKKEIKLTKYQKNLKNYWLNKLEDRRLTLLLSTLKEELNCGMYDVNVHSAVSRQVDRCAKRAKFHKPELAAKAESDFVNTNSIAGSIEIRLDAEVAANARLFIERALWAYSSEYIDCAPQTSLDYGLLLSLWRYGPGASYGLPGITHFADKIGLDEITVTKKVVPLIKHLRFLNPHTNLYDKTAGNKLVLREMQGSCLSTVPKNEDTHRTICTEPLGNMALQLAAGVYIEGALHRCGVTLSTQQDKNKVLAEKGSLDGSLATIDLKSASDMITPALIEQLWPRDWYELLMLIRSDKTLLSGGAWLDLNMISTMGNGFTFPLMTMTLLALIYGFNAKNELGFVNHVDFTSHAVYGDDIICPVSSFDGVVEVLESAGLVINKAKSYSTGGFRESCGGDFMKGYNITPFYIESLRSDSEVYVVINKLLSWCGTHNVYLTDTLKLLVSFLRSPEEPFFVPEWEMPTSGILCTGFEKKYKRLDPIKFVRFKETDSNLLVLMILGGYVESSWNGSICYSPRSTNVEYRVKVVTLPPGWVGAICRHIRTDRQRGVVSRMLLTI